jgi:uncharacterized membrane protein required for colicin V production
MEEMDMCREAINKLRVPECFKIVAKFFELLRSAFQNNFGIFHTKKKKNKKKKKKKKKKTIK